MSSNSQPFVNPGLRDLAPSRRLAGKQERLDELAFATNDHAGKRLEPFPFRHFGFGMEPVCQKTKLIGGNLPADDAVEQMIKQAGRKVVAANSRPGYSP